MVFENIKLYSFDVFDTLITRKVATPRGIFAAVQEKLKSMPEIPEILSKNFLVIRMKSETIAGDILSKITKTRTVTFDSIYEQMQKRYSISNENIEKLKNLEIETEFENQIPISKNINKLKTLLKQNKKVVLISDMYFSSEMIRKFLLQFDEIFKDIKIYVSCEHTASKYSGALYELISIKEQINFKNWQHFGDNEHSDYESAKKLGIKAIKYNYPKFMPYEQDAIKLYINDYLVQKQIGAARELRLNNKYVNAKYSDKYEFGASYSGPVLYNYADFILKTAIKRGFKTLYFVARDGYIIKLIADIIIKKQNLPIKTKYIYGSRIAWRLVNKNNYEKTIKATNLPSLYFACKILGIPKDLILKYIPAKFFKEKLNEGERKYIKNTILYNDSLKEEFLNLNKNREELLLEYLKQEINFEEKDIAFVDSCGTGTTINTLAGHLKSISPDCSVYNFFLPCVKKNLCGDIVEFIGYFKVLRPIADSAHIEFILRKDEGQTIGYYKKDGNIYPKTEEIDVSLFYKWGYEEYIEGIKDFAENTCNVPKDNEGLNLSYSYYDYVAGVCDKKMAKIIGDIPFKRNDIEVDKNPVVSSKPSLYATAKFFITGKYNGIKFPKIAFARMGINIFKFKTIEYYLPSLPQAKLKNYLNKTKNQKVVLWGASIFLEEFIKKQDKTFDNVVAIVDKNQAKRGKYIGEYPIISPEDLDDIYFDYIVLTIKNSNEKIYPEIKKYITKQQINCSMLPNIFDKKSPIILHRKYTEKRQLTVVDTKKYARYSENNLKTIIQNSINTTLLHQKIFMPYKNKYNNKEIVIVGTHNPTGQYDDNKIYIGTDDSFKLSKVNFDYIFLQNYSDKTKEYICELNNYNPETCIKFYALSNEKNKDNIIPESEAIKANALRYITDENNSSFTYDLSSYPISNKTAIFSALQFALWTNPKKIYLDGCDFDFKEIFKKQDKYSPDFDYLLKSFKDFKVFSNLYYPDTEIIAINPVNLKGIFKDCYQNCQLIQN